MSRRLRALPSWAGLLVRAAGLLVAFFAALAVGATAAVVVGWQQGPAVIGAGGPDGSNALRSSGGENAVFENGTRETTVERISRDAPDADASFLHHATDQNSRGDYTYLSDPSIDRDPDALVLVEPAPDVGTADGNAYDHNIGVWYEPVTRRWAVFNQDLASVPAGTAFRVVVPRGPDSFIHRFDTPEGASENDTQLDHPLVNGNPQADISVTQNWNPGGGVGVYNDHPVGVRYDAGRGRWSIFNQDLAPIKDGVAFNVSVAGPEKGP